MNRLTHCLLSFLAALVAAISIPSLASAAPTELIRYHGDGSSATGAALANAGRCDVNGDGYSDAVVGAWFWDKAPLSNIGAAYVILGSPGPKGGSLNNPSSADAVRIDGPSVANAFVGFAVGCLGDVDGDGYDDVGISHYTAQKAFVVFGDEEFSPVDLGLLGSRGFEVRGDPATAGNVGFSLAPVGDLDGDGLAEFGVAEVVADTLGRTNNGRIWVISGQDDIADVDLDDPAPGQIRMTVEGANPEERLGVLSEVGDVNGDGRDDFLVGSYTSTPWGSGVPVPGAAAVVWGGTTGQVDLASLGENGFRILGPTRGRDRLGISVSGVGDVNGDGKADLLIGADGVYNAATGNRNGSAYLVHGSASTATVYTSAPANDSVPSGPSDVTVFTCDDDPGTGVCDDPADVQPRGYRITGAANSDSTAYSVAGIGDVSGDGIPDLAIGAYGFDPVNPANPPATMSGAGAVWVVHGKTGTAPQNLAGLTAAEGYRIDGLAAGDRMGRQVGSLGDFDGNGVTDLVGSGDFAARPTAPGTPLSHAGEVLIGLNGALATGTELSVAPEGTTAQLGQEFTLTASAERLSGSGGVVDAGTFAFKVDGETIAGCATVALTAGVATCEVAPSQRGDHAFAAEYSGVPGSHLGSEAEPTGLTLVDTTATTLESSDVSVTIGRPLTFTASVEPSGGGASVDAGTVTFTLDGHPVPGCGATPVTAGIATCATTIDEAGEHEVGATYSGSADLDDSAATPVGQQVGTAPVATVSFTRNPAVPVKIGDQINLRAEVEAAGAPADHGSVEFRSDGHAITGCDSVALVDGVATCDTSFPSRGRVRLDAVYRPGAISIAGSSSDPAAIDVRDGSTLNISADPADLHPGEPVTVTSRVVANAGGAVDEGSVRLTADGCTGCGTAAVAAGTAAQTISFDRPGTYTVAGAYTGGTWVEDSTAPPLIVKVTAVPETPACRAVRPGATKADFSSKGRSLGLRITASGRASIRVTPVIHFIRGGEKRKITLAPKVQELRGSRLVRFRLTAAQAKRLTRHVVVGARLRARPVAVDCVAADGPLVARNLGRVGTGKAR